MPDYGRGYGESWPGGPWIHSGNLPAGLSAELLHFRVSADARIIGQTGPENHARYWTGTQWLDLGQTEGVSIGAFHPMNGRVYVSGHDGIRVYERDGTEVTSAFIPGYAGSQGIRWIDPDGTVHTGDQTVSGPPLWEWTHVGDLRIGQGGPDAPDEGVRVVGPDGVLRAVNHDVARFIRVNAAGDRIDICYLRTSDGENVRIETTRAQLLASPPVVADAPAQPPVVSTPSTQPQEPKPLEFPNHIDVVQRERAKFPQATLTEEQCFTVTNAVAADPAVKADGWGLTKAPAGGSGFIVNGQNYRLDKLCHPAGYINDILSDTPGAAGAQWGPNADANGNPSNWAPAVSIAPAPAPVPQPTPTPAPNPAPSVDLSAVLSAIADLRSEVMALHEQIAAIQPPSAQGPMYGTVAIPYLGSARVDLVPGTRPQGK